MGDNRPFFKHFVAEIYDLDFDLANSSNFLNKKMRKLMKMANVPIIKSQKFQFSPQGLSMVYILAASHLALHSWPEKGYLHLDLLTCSEETNLNLFEADLRNEFQGLQLNCKILDY